MKYTSSVLRNLYWSMEIDLHKDFTDIMKNRMLKIGVEPSNDKDCVYEYFNLLKRIVPQTPRIVKKSKEFNCPKEYEYALDEIEDKIVKGDSLIPFMSDSILKPDFNDGLLNDWNIYHLHLTKRFRADGFAKRSDYELFVYFTEETAYFIQIYPHNKKNLYSTQDMVRIIYDNWPQLIEKNRINAVSLTQEIDDEAYGELRKANISTFVQIRENEIFGLIGGGYMSNGFSTEALRSADHWYNLMKIREQVLIENVEFILRAIKQVNHTVNSDLDICLLWLDSDDKTTFLDKTNHVIIQLDFTDHIMRVCKPFEVFGFELGSIPPPKSY